MTGKLVVNRAMSLDGFVAGPDDSMDWVFEYATPDQVPDVMAATGAGAGARVGAGVTAMRFRVVGACAG